jgi:hypothetical protein
MNFGRGSQRPAGQRLFARAAGGCVLSFRREEKNRTYWLGGAGVSAPRGDAKHRRFNMSLGVF